MVHFDGIVVHYIWFQMIQRKNLLWNKNIQNQNNEIYWYIGEVPAQIYVFVIYHSKVSTAD